MIATSAFESAMTKLQLFTLCIYNGILALQSVMFFEFQFIAISLDLLHNNIMCIQFRIATLKVLNSAMSKAAIIDAV